MANSHSQPQPDLIELIPDPDTVRTWLADSLRRAELMRCLLRISIRKAGLNRRGHTRDREAACVDK